MCERSETVIMILQGKPTAIDGCIAPVVEALNAAGLETIASCCGHGYRPGNIVLRDRREVMILPDYETARRVDRLFPKDINGEAWMEGSGD